MKEEGTGVDLTIYKTLCYRYFILFVGDTLRFTNNVCKDSNHALRAACAKGLHWLVKPLILKGASMEARDVKGVGILILEKTVFTSLTCFLSGSPIRICMP
jgi:hypothetical protein